MSIKLQIIIAVIIMIALCIIVNMIPILLLEWSVMRWKKE